MTRKNKKNVPTITNIQGLSEAIKTFQFPDQRMSREAEMEMMARHFSKYLGYVPEDVIAKLTN